MGAGGAIFVHGGTLTAANTTFTANSATGGAAGAAIMATSRGNGGVGGGGAIFNLNGTVRLYNSTIAGNTVTGGAGQVNGNASGGALLNLAIGSGSSATTTLRNSILSNSKGGPDLFVDGVQGSSSVDATGSNLVMTSATMGGGVVTGTPRTTDPMLAALANNMGPSQTMALPTGSPALGVGDAAVCAMDPVLGVDQRGQPRACACDLGAFAYPLPMPCAVMDLAGMPSDDGGTDDGGASDDGGALSGYRQITGGGFGCSLASSGSSTGLAQLGLLALIGLTVRTRRRRVGY